MDYIIEQKKGFAAAFTKKAVPFWLGGAVVAAVVYLLLQSDSRSLKVDAETLTISNVTRNEFNDYVRISGQVVPQTTIQLSPLEGG
ncbi:MAG: efflux transporter periplasmic adaptor subunit, partial [Salinivirgaceae bacterium]|nr:efflux transporter periplasmic adaptor subunit [Salinivirgaceae bacterium]